MKLRSHLVLLVVVALLPVLAFGFAMLVVLGRDQQADLHESLATAARALSLAVDRELEASIRVLAALSTSEHLDTGDLRRFYEQSRRALEHLGGWDNIVLVETTGQILVSTSVPFGAPLPATANPELVRNVVQTGAPVVSNLFTGAVTGRLVVAVLVPVTRDGRVKYTLTSVATPGFLARLLAQQQVPSGWLGTIIDRNQIIIARTRDPGTFIGQSASLSFAAASRHVEAEGVTAGVTLDGVPVHAGFHRSRLSGWTLGLAVPTAVLEAPLQRSLLIAGVAWLVLGLASLGLALVLGRRIARPIAALADTATRKRAAPPARIVSGVTEVAEVAHVLDVSFARLAASEEATRKLAALGMELAGILDLAKASERIVHEVLGLIPARRAMLYRFDPAAGTLVCVAGAGDGEPAWWIGHTRPASDGLSGLAIAESRPLASADVFHDPRLKAVPVAVGQVSGGCHAWISVPLQSGGETLGTLVVGDTVGRVFSEGEIRLVAAFAGAAALALRNAQLFAESERRRLAAEALAEGSRDLARSLDSRVIAQEIVERTRSILDVSVAQLFRLEPGSGDLVPVAVSGATILPRNFALARGTGWVGLAVREGTPVQTSSQLADPRVVFTPEARAHLEAAAPRSVLATPLLVQDAVIGALFVSSEEGRVFRAEEVELVQALADQGALAIHNARLFETERAGRAQLGALAEIGRELTAELDEDRLLQLVVDRVGRLLDGHGLIYLPETEGWLVPRAVSESTPFSPVTLPLGRGVTGVVAQERRGLIVNDYPDWPAALPDFRDTVKRMLGQPLVVRERLLGVIIVSRTAADARPFTEEDLALLEQFATQAAIALDNAGLFRDVRAGRERLEALSRRLLDAQEAAARDFARLLHDEIGQSLTALKLNLEALQQKEAPGETAARLRDSTAIVDTALEQVRSLSLTLRPSVLDDLGLAAALRWAVHREAARAGLEAELALAPGDTRMQPELETACFRIAQEALTNVVRHAQASRVRVALDRNDGELTLTVGDDGAGFDVAAARQRAVAGESLGLLGMEERALLLGGRLEIESASGAGTTVRARLPLAAGPVAEDTA